ncbi:uncharacterized protein A4U43_C06F3170 [Asparagus officinalis]|uniref:Uncharacterized protein n=1 Tax=Asparagus officinalis TaxID=4686 RepID=A0A5P1EJ88_ASPOF|nr:uncharacterized protein LOC109845582 [Asparagus officinalis]ONK66002.1 uncharacterized protein A4U43_C06F3170 [Asparagus officinalis]
MRRTPIFSKDGNGEFSELDYDPHVDFSKFLEEARKYANDAKLNPNMHSHTNATPSRIHKGERSWKGTLFFWRKLTKRGGEIHGGMATKPSNGSNASKRRHVSVSGLICGDGISRRVDRPASGPLAGWFTPTRAEESEAPYVCLDVKRHASGANAFGPIYRVT